MNTLSTVTCVGAGNVGRAWAIVFARAGLKVRLFDVSEQALAAAMAAIRTSLHSLDAADGSGAAPTIEARISPGSSLADALDGADYVQESVSERLDLKQALFADLDERCPPEVILASSTSELAPSTFLKVAKHPERCLVAHPLNPPYLIPLVELCPAPATSSETLTATRNLLEHCGMSCLALKKEISGFVVNRLQGALLREALRLTQDGYCTPEDVDRALTEGLGRRWVFLGPFATGHLNSSSGFAGYMDMLGPAWRRLFAQMQDDVSWTPDLVSSAMAALNERYPPAQIDAAQAWRDQRLLALRQHLDAAGAFDPDDERSSSAGENEHE